MLKPFKHQAWELMNHAHTEARGLFWEPGTGKTKPVIDTAAELFQSGRIDAMLVLAPNMVHRNWVSDELPKHLPERLQARTATHIWYSKKSKTKQHAASYQHVLNYEGFAVLVMSYNSVLTAAGQKAWKGFLKKRRCLYVLDESHRIKSPNAKSSKRVMSSKGAAQFRRCLTGTPITNKPFDLYNQLRFLDPFVWQRYGLHTFSMFKNFFGIWKTFKTEANGKEITFTKCVTYRNLDILREEVARLGSRVLKEDVLDLPPKLYSRVYVELTPAQKRAYRDLRDELETTIAGEDAPLTAAMAMTRLLRFQQVVCGYLPRSDDDATLFDLPGGNPRLDALAQYCEQELEGRKVIVWARFTRDIDLITGHKLLAKDCVRYDGQTSDEDRRKALDEFQHGGVPIFVGNPAALSSGVTLHAAHDMVYYSNNFRYDERLQTEDRVHRIGQVHPCKYVDFIASGTVDEHILRALLNKQDVASQITGDTIKDWI